MSIFGPFAVSPGLLERATNFMDFIVKTRPGTTAYRLWMADTIENAYGTMAASGLAGSGGVDVMVVARNGIGQTAQIVRRGWRVEENRRGSTSFQVDPNDVVDAGISLADDHVLFARLQEQRAGTWLVSPGPANLGYEIRGPIVVVPPKVLLASMPESISLQASAPLGTNCIAATVPVVDGTVQTPLPIHLYFARPASTLTLSNLSVGDTLLYSMGLGQPMVSLGPGEETTPTGGAGDSPGVREIILAADVWSKGAISFGIVATLV